MLSLFQLRAAEQRQDEQVCQDVDDATGKDDETEALGRRKIGQYEDGKASGEDRKSVV